MNLRTCKIDSQTTKYCKYCRYDKCLAIGMIKTMVRNDKSEYNLREKSKSTRFATKNVRNKRDNSTITNTVETPRCDIACSGNASTATKIIDLAQKYSPKTLFLNNEVIRIYI